MFISLKPLAERGGLTTAARHRPPAPRAVARGGHQRVHDAPRRTSASARGRAGRDYQFTLLEPGVRRPLRLGAEGRGPLAPGSRARRRQHRPRAGRAAGQHHRSTGRRPRASACASRTSTTRSTTPSRSGRSRPSTRSATSTASCSRSTRATSAIPTDLSRIFVPGRDGAQVPLDSVIRLEKTLAPLVVNHQGPFPAVTISYNLRPDATLDEAHAGDPAGGRRAAGCPIPSAPRRPATPRPSPQQASTQPLLIIAALICGLHRAGRALREPGAPADHHLDAAVGRPRRADRAAGSPTWSCP